MTPQPTMGLGQIGGEGLGPFAKIVSTFSNNPQGVFAALGTLISNIIGVMTIAGALWFLFQFVIAGYGWITAGGDKTKLTAAQDRIKNAVVGLLIVVIAVVFLDLITRLLGFDSFLSPSRLVEQLAPPGAGGGPRPTIPPRPPAVTPI